MAQTEEIARENSLGGDNSATQSPPHSPGNYNSAPQGFVGTPATPTATSSAGGQWSTPTGGAGSSAGSVSEQAPQRFRTLSDLFDSTDEIHNYEYSGVCLLAADELASIEEALEEKCWRDAM
jgi:hypothetical protein